MMLSKDEIASIIEHSFTWPEAEHPWWPIFDTAAARILSAEWEKQCETKAAAALGEPGPGPQEAREPVAFQIRRRGYPVVWGGDEKFDALIVHLSREECEEWIADYHADDDYSIHPLYATPVEAADPGLLALAESWDKLAQVPTINLCSVELTLQKCAQELRAYLSQPKGQAFEDCVVRDNPKAKEGR